jgi:hypothetical protein
MTTRLFLQISIYTGEEFMVPYILVGMFVAFETQKLCRAILGGAGALLGGKRRRSELTRSIQPQCGGRQLTKSGLLTTLRLLFAFVGVKTCYGDISSIDKL